MHNKVSIIALGETGSGKSLFCKLFSKSEEFISKKSMESVTTEIKCTTFRRENKDSEIFLIDTPGTNDSRGKEQDKLNLQLIRDFVLTQPRINCIIIVMNSKMRRMSDSIKDSIINICRTFPLPDFWNHVIIFWTNWVFLQVEEYEEAQQFIENEVMEEFRKLSKYIEDELHINIRQIGPNVILPMIYNEYNESSKNKEIIKKNIENTESNFDKIIDLVKEMKPLYETVYPPENFVELQEPKNGMKAGNDTKFKYHKIIRRKYKDFNKTDIIENLEKVGEYTITMQEKDSNWEYNPEKNKKIQYTIRNFYDENGMQINKPMEISVEEKEKKHEIDILKERREEVNNRRRRIYLVDRLTYPGESQSVEENRTFVEEIEEGETDWEEDINFHEPNTKKYNKFKTITKNGENGQQIGETRKTEIIDWKTIETIVEDNIPIRITDNITRFVKRTTIKELTSKDSVPKVSPNEEQIKIEKIDKEFEKVNNLDNNNLGIINYNCYNIKYINDVKDPNYRILNDEESYTLTYKKEDVLKTINETREGLDYEKSYYEIYFIDSRTPNIKNRTDFKIYIGSEKLINTITKIDRREIGITGSTIRRQNYKQYYRLENGNEIFVKEEKDGDEYDDDIIYGPEYPEIESPMSNQIVDELKREKKYPINFIRNYYKDEINTLLKQKIKTKSERVEIRIEHFKNVTDANCNGNIKKIEEYDAETIYINDIEEKTTMINEINYTLTKVQDNELKTIKDTRDGLEYEKYYYEIYYIDSRNPNTKIPSDIKKFTGEEKLINGKIKIDRREINKTGNKIIRQNYKQYYRLMNGNEIFVMEEKEGKEYKDDIIYSAEYSEIESPMTNQRIDELKRMKKYPINYIRNYYKDEINTLIKQKKIKTKSHRVEIIIKHFKNENINNYNENIKKIEEYDEEITYINDVRQNSTRINEINYTLTKVQDNELKAIKDTRDGLEYEKYYYEIYYIDSRNPNTKINSDIKKFTGEEKLINGKIKIDRREIDIIGKKIIRQNYKQYYRIMNGNEIFVREEKEGKEYEEDIIYGPEIGEIKEPMNLPKINELKKSNKYPINYIINYYKEATNTKKPNKLRTRSVNVEIKLNHKLDISRVNEDLKKIEEYDLEQIFYDNILHKELQTKLNYKTYNKGIVEKRVFKEKIENLERKVEHWLTKNEHYFDIYEVTEILYADGTKDKFRSYIDTELERYG